MFRSAEFTGSAAHLKQLVLFFVPRRNRFRSHSLERNRPADAEAVTASEKDFKPASLPGTG
jgi:hypothetical protein